MVAKQREISKSLFLKYGANREFNNYAMKQDLTFSKPIMNSAGTLGFVVDTHLPVDWSKLGAFVSNPISLHKRIPSHAPICEEYPGGFLLHTGLPNLGLELTIRRFSNHWTKSSLPMIIHLIADHPEETKGMVRRLEGINNLIGVELEFAPLTTNDAILTNLDMCLGELPLIFSLSPAKILNIGGRLISKGVTALSLARSRGAFTASYKKRLLAGRLFGPNLFPISLEFIYMTATMGLRVIGSGGVWSEHQAQSMLNAGAIAVQMDAGFWLPNNKDLVG